MAPPNPVRAHAGEKYLCAPAVPGRLANRVNRLTRLNAAAGCLEKQTAAAAAAATGEFSFSSRVPRPLYPLRVLRIRYAERTEFNGILETRLIGVR